VTCHSLILLSKLVYRLLKISELCLLEFHFNYVSWHRCLYLF
jgi:hypothetical protein